MQRAEMVRVGAEQLFVTENAMDTTLCELSKLANILVGLRMDSKLSAVIGQEVVESIALSYTRLSKARGAILQIHRDLDTVKTQIGCGAVAVGTDGDKPGTGGRASGRLITVVGGSEEAA